MKKFDDLSLRSKFYLSFATGGGVLVAAILFCVYQLRVIGNEVHEIAGNYLPSLQVAGSISQERLRYRVRSLELMLPGSAEDKAKIGKSLQDLEKGVSEAVKSYAPLVSSPEEQGAYDRLTTAVNAYSGSVRKAVALLEAGKEDEAQQLRRSEWTALANQVRDSTDQLVKINRTLADAAVDRVNRYADRAIYGSVAALVAGIAAAAVIIAWMAGLVSRRLGETVEAAKRIAGKDLQQSLPVESGDEVGSLIKALGAMQTQLRATLQQTQQHARTLAEAAGQFVSSSEQLAASAGTQSEAASAIAANVEQLTVSINHISASSGDARQFAEESEAQAEEGRQVLVDLCKGIERVVAEVQQAASQIAVLAEHSEKISGVVAVIKEIADQTNLLALNAAIEAARAGEQGRGFAVVADEVRKLAERTALSTDEIVQTVDSIQSATHQVVEGIRNGVGSAEEGAAQARKAGEVIAGLKEKSVRLSALVGEVASAMAEQSSASTDVAQRVEVIATHAEETSGITANGLDSAKGLQQISREMQQTVADFRV